MKITTMLSLIARRETNRCSAFAVRKISAIPIYTSLDMVPYMLAYEISEKISTTYNNTRTMTGRNWMSAAIARVLFKGEQTPLVFNNLNQQRYAEILPAAAGEVSEYVESLFGGILFVKRTFQPSLLRRKRKHGFLARQGTRHGRKIMQHRRAKGRSSLCA